MNIQFLCQIHQQLQKSLWCYCLTFFSQTVTDYNRSISWAFIYFFCDHVSKGLETTDGLYRFSSRPTNTLFENIHSVGCSGICIANMYDKLCLIYTPFLSTWKKSLKHHRSIIVALKHRSSLLLYFLCDIICYRGYFSIGRVWDQGSTGSLSRLKQFVKCRSLWQRSTDKQSR